MIPVGFRFHELDEAALQRLIDDGIEESRFIDYKRGLVLGDEGQKLKFCKHLAALANTAGGYVFYGIDEEEGKPTEIVGLPNINPDDFRLTMLNVARTHIAPPITGFDIRSIDIEGKPPVLAAHVPKSWIGPHMLNDKRFYIRESNQSRPMDWDEVQSAFGLSGQLPERLRKFRARRRKEIVEGEPVYQMGGQRRYVLLHMVPLSAYQPGNEIVIGESIRTDLKLCPISTRGLGKVSRYNLDGILVCACEKDTEVRSCTQLFRNGTIEAVDTKALDEPGGYSGQVLRIDEMQFLLLSAVRRYLDFCDTTGIIAPIAVMLTLARVRNSIIKYDGQKQGGPRPIDRDDLYLPETIVEDTSSRASTVMQNAFDALWQSSGYARCYSYDEEGNYRDGDL